MRKMNKNIKSNTELSTIKEAALEYFEEYMKVRTCEQLVDCLRDDKGYLANIPEATKAVELFMVHKDFTMHMAEKAIVEVMADTLVKQPTLGTLNSKVAEMFSRHDYTPVIRFRLAAVLLRMLENSGLFNVVKELNKKSNLVKVARFAHNISEVGFLDLAKKLRKPPATSFPVKASSKLVGSQLKYCVENPQMLDVTGKLNNIGYTSSAKVWNKYKETLAQRKFGHPDAESTRQAFIEMGDSLLGKTFYFGHKFGPDNGRIYCDGDLMTLQSGALNFIYKFADKRMLTSRGLKALEQRVQELRDVAEPKLKEEMELYSLELDLQDAKDGKPVGTILYIDAKLSGLQHQAIATRSKELAGYCGLLAPELCADGYLHIKDKMANRADLTRDLVKSAYNPYQYGAGKAKTLEPVEKAKATLDFEEWEKAYSAAFPEAFALRTYLLEVATNFKAESHEFTSPSGFKCVLTAIGTETDTIATCYGKMEFARSEIDKDHMSVRVVAAFSHMLDASVLHTVVRAMECDISVIHDSFGTHPNHTYKVEEAYVTALLSHLEQPVLQNYVSSITGTKNANVSRLMANTLKSEDIVGGLF